MAESGKVTLDASKISQGSSLSLTNESIITLYVFGSVGSHDNHEIGLEIRPDASSNWFRLDPTVTGEGHKTIQVAAKEVRSVVIVPEGGVSEVETYIIAR